MEEQQASGSDGDIQPLPGFAERVGRAARIAAKEAAFRGWLAVVFGVVLRRVTGRSSTQTAAIGIAFGRILGPGDAGDGTILL